MPPSSASRPAAKTRCRTPRAGAAEGTAYGSRHHACRSKSPRSTATIWGDPRRPRPRPRTRHTAGATAKTTPPPPPYSPSSPCRPPATVPPRESPSRSTPNSTPGPSSAKPSLASRRAPRARWKAAKRSPSTPRRRAADHPQRRGASSGLDFELRLRTKAWPTPAGSPKPSREKIDSRAARRHHRQPLRGRRAGGLHRSPVRAERPTPPRGKAARKPPSSARSVAHTPLLEEPLEGSLYLASPTRTPRHPDRPLPGLPRPRTRRADQAGRQVEPDPETGQLQTHLRRPAAAALLRLHAALPRRRQRRRWSPRRPAAPTPPPPSSTPSPTPTARRTRDSPSQINAESTAAPARSGGLPFHPGLRSRHAATTPPAPTRPSIMRLTRKDGEQDLDQLLDQAAPGPHRPLAGIRDAPRRHRQGALAHRPPRRARRAGRPLLPGGLADRPSPVGAGVGGVLT